MFKRKSIYVAASLMAASLWGCGSNYSSGGDQTGPDQTLANAATVGMDNCLTCHSAFSPLVQDYLVSRHGNQMLGSVKGINDTEVPVDDVSSDGTTSGSPSSCNYCHDPLGDRNRIELTEVQAALQAFSNLDKTVWSLLTPPTNVGSLIGCEGCHGGGQFHNGIAAGIPYATPGPKQCGQCHYLNDDLANKQWIADGEYPHHDDSSNGNNVRRNIMDTHYDNPATGYGLTTNLIEGYAIRASQQNGCVDCHFGGHLFDLAINYAWANSAHGGHIKLQKDTALAAGLPAAVDAATRLQLLADVTAAGADSTTGDAWLHYDWDRTTKLDTDGITVINDRGSCQTCHTTTGIANFLSGPGTYDLTGRGNDFSHLAGWSKAANGKVTSSGQNELLYCWGCHSDSKGTLRNPGPIPMEYTYSGVTVVIPEARKSNVCVKCHGGRGNLDTILANVAAADASLTDTVDRSTRAAEHHAPTAGSLFAAQTHTAFEFAGMDYSGAPAHAAIDTGSTGSGPCAACHMGGVTSQEHTFAAVESIVDNIPTAGHVSITAINHPAVCAFCHAAGDMDVADLQLQKDGFSAAKTVLSNLLKNTPVNYLNLNISTTTNNNYKTVPLNAYGAFMNHAYMGEEPCAYVHNNLYARRILFDSIKFMKDGTLIGTLDLTGFAAAAEFISPGYGNIATIARPGDVG